MPSDKLLLCQEDSYLRVANHEVLSCIPINDRFLITLNDSVFYAEGGGQPFDIGTINDNVQVFRVNKKQDAENIVELEVSHELPVHQSVKCEVNFDRRYDFMQHHSAQHLFSAIAEQEFNLDTTSWALTPDNATVDLVLRGTVAESSDKKNKSAGGAISMETLKLIEEKTNAKIREALPITSQVISKEEIVRRKDNNEILFVNVFNGLNGPALHLDEIRLVRIGDSFDLNPCGGTHVRNTAEIQIFQVLGLEKHKEGIRLRFQVGHRALKVNSQSLLREQQLTGLLSVPNYEHVDFVGKIMKDKMKQEKEIEKLQEEIAKYYANSLLTHITTRDNTLPENRIIVLFKRDVDLKFLLSAATTIIESYTTVPLLLFLASNATDTNSSKNNKKKGKDNAVVKPAVEISPLSLCIPDDISTTEGSGPFVLFGDSKIVDSIKVSLLPMIDAKGGGRPGRLQGQAKNLLPMLQTVKDFLVLEASK